MALHDEPQKSSPDLLVAGTAPPSHPDVSAGAVQESHVRDMMVEALWQNVDELKRVNKNLEISIEGQGHEIEKLGCQRWWLIFLVILLLGTGLFFTVRWVIAQVETAEHNRRIGELQVKKFRTIEEAAELAWKRENWPSESTVSWKRTHRKYYAQLGTKKIIGKWASIDVKMIFKGDGRSCYFDFYFLEKGNDGAWKVIRNTGKFPWWDDVPCPEPEIPKDIRKQLDWW